MPVTPGGCIALVPYPAVRHRGQHNRLTALREDDIVRPGFAARFGTKSLQRFTIHGHTKARRRR